MAPVMTGQYTGASFTMLNADQLRKIIYAKCPKVGLSTICVVAVRGSDGHNDLGVFDDRCYVMYDGALKGTWAMNTDPSSDVTGRAHLLPGVYTYQAGKHHINQAPPLGRPAFIQAGEVNIHRTNQGDEHGFFGINLHDATGGTTSSLGCQTFKQYGGESDFYNDQGTGFRDVMYRILNVNPSMVMKHPEGVGNTFKYILIDATEANNLTS
jgi:hypothetical protein